MSDRQQAEAWARALLADGTALILDSETTGLDTTDEIVQLAICDLTGAVLLDTLIKPSKPIPAAATAIHHITDAMVASSPTFDQVWPQIATLLADRLCIIYNAAYDTGMLISSRAAGGGAYLSDISSWWQRYAAAETEVRALRFDCAMERYSQWVGDWSEWHQSYRWQRLPSGDHSALGDCRACLAVLKRMAGHVDIDVAKEQVTND